MALFSELKTDSEDNTDLPPQPLEQLLHERTRTRSLKEVRKRDLPAGCDLKQLEKYLSDEDFEKVFHMGKTDFEKLAQWKKIAMKKEANLF
jgi:supervillin